MMSNKINFNQGPKNGSSILKALFAILLIFSGLTLGALGQEEEGDRPLVLYSGRSEALVAPLLARFTEESGIQVNVRYGDTAELAVLLQEEGQASPADLYWAQDGGALGALSTRNLLAPLPADLGSGLPESFRSNRGLWVATSGRARVLAYSRDRVSAEEFPSSYTDLSQAPYRGRVGWALTNGSFQAFVTAIRQSEGEEAARAWLSAMKDNGTLNYRNNTSLLAGIAAGEIDFALVNNYYLLRFLKDDPQYPVAQRFFENGDVGNLVNVAGAAIVRASDNQDRALQFLRFLLTEEAQEYFTQEVNEYPVIPNVAPNPELEDFGTLLERSPGLNLDLLEDLEGTLELLQELELL